MRLDAIPALRAIRAYNVGSYRGRPNLEVDRAAYDRFRGGVPANRDELIDAIRFVGEDYGGAQRRFLPHGHREEAALIAERLVPVLETWSTAVSKAPPLRDQVPPEYLLSFLFDPFAVTKRWPV